MKEKFPDATLKANVKSKLMEFYQTHQEECDKLYTDAMDKGMFNIYEEIEDGFLVNLLFVKTEVVILTANTFEKNILHLNAVKTRKQKI